MTTQRCTWIRLILSIAILLPTIWMPSTLLAQSTNTPTESPATNFPEQDKLAEQCLERLKEVALVYTPQEFAPFIEEILPVLKSEIADSPQAIGNCYFYLGMVYDSTQDWSHALWAFDLAAQMVDEAEIQWFALQAKGGVLDSQRRLHEALETFEEALELTEDNSTAKEWGHPTLKRLARALTYNLKALGIVQSTTLNQLNQLRKTIVP
ncbi:MAG: tetratricopeptide repeat protein, partial [Chloroflexota bacterium]